MRSNYDKNPSIPLKNEKMWKGWEDIVNCLKKTDEGKDEKTIIAIETYQGVNHDELKTNLRNLNPDILIDTSELFAPEEKIREKTWSFVTDNEVFGYRSNLQMNDFMDSQKIATAKSIIKDQSKGLIVIYGYGSVLVESNPNILVWADMARWEIQKRMRRNEVDNLGVRNRNDSFSEKYKRGFFVDWRVCDRLKKSYFAKMDYILDTNQQGNPKMISGRSMLNGLQYTASRPFRVEPFFDPGPWGGQWMKEVCDLDPDTINFAWCFDCVPEENSLVFEIEKERFEIPALNLVFCEAANLLGEQVEARFGREFPIRFDLLDTMNGGNLSFQVHPTTDYIMENFGMHYTQDESYYLLDTKDEGAVYLGLKEDVDSHAMINDLEKAQEGEEIFDVDLYVNKFKAKKHDHYLIPSGTVHCSGINSMVLEISATPYIFTFKLWDWGRLGLDGKPRPINIEHGEKVINWKRDTNFVKSNLINKVETIAEGDGWREEKTGMHDTVFIETRRHWFTKKVLHNTNNSVNVLNLVEGREAIIESPTDQFESFVVHYAETFIVPAAVKEYTIRPYGESVGKEIATIKAYVRL